MWDNMEIKPKLYICTGAGISAESGIPTFRSTGQLWNDPDVCNIETFKQNYHKAHNFYNDLRVNLGKAKPNAAHDILVDLEAQFGSDVVKIITTNVDDLQERAGSFNVVHLHGKLTEIVTGYFTYEEKVEDIGYTEFDHLACEDIDDMVKPNVIFFGEPAPEYSHLYSMLNDATEADIMLIIGTSNQVVDFDDLANSFPGLTYNINPECSELDQRCEYTADVRESAIDGLRMIKDELVQHMTHFRLNT